MAASMVSQYQMSAREYTEILKVLAQRAPCRLLVYGVGKDSHVYHRLNAGEGAVTLFVEHDAAWADTVAKDTPGLEILRVRYTTTVGASLAGIKAGQRTTASTGVMDMGVDWDVIIVDGPPGEVHTNPGRELPIMEAATFALEARQTKRVDVFVHDVNRELEARACAFYLSGETADSYDRSRHYVLVPEGEPIRPGVKRSAAELEALGEGEEEYGGDEEEEEGEEGQKGATVARS